MYYSTTYYREIKILQYTPNNQFVKIHIDKNSKCVEAIPSLNSTLYSKRILDKINKCAKIILSPNSALYPERIPDQSQVTTSVQNSTIDLKICDDITSKGINLVYTPTKKMLADELTVIAGQLVNY